MFVTLTCAFRYGREDLDVLGLSFRKDLFIANYQAFPPAPNPPRPPTRLQDRLLRKLGPHAHPFFFTVRTPSTLYRARGLPLSCGAGGGGRTVRPLLLAHLESAVRKRPWTAPPHPAFTVTLVSVSSLGPLPSSPSHPSGRLLQPLSGDWEKDLEEPKPPLASPQIPQNLPCSVTLQPGPEDTGKVQREWVRGFRGQNGLQQEPGTHRGGAVREKPGWDLSPVEMWSVCSWVTLGTPR